MILMMIIVKNMKILNLYYQIVILIVIMNSKLITFMLQVLKMI